MVTTRIILALLVLLEVAPAPERLWQGYELPMPLKKTELHPTKLVIKEHTKIFLDGKPVVDFSAVPDDAEIIRLVIEEDRETIRVIYFRSKKP